MGRPPCCDKTNVKRGLWTPEEDAKILAYVSNYGIGNWTLVPKKAGLNRCGKSCRLRWTNYLRPDLKHDNFTPQEEELIINLHAAIGSRWSLIAKRLPGRTDNDVKNYWNTKLRKKLMNMGIDPVTHKPVSQVLSDLGSINGLPSTGNQIGFEANKDLMNNNMLPTRAEPSLLTANAGIKSNQMVDQIHEEQAQFWENQVQYQPNVVVFNETASSSSSSSSSSNLTQLSSPQLTYSFQNLQITPPSSASFDWSDFLHGDSFVWSEIQQCDLQREMSSAACEAYGAVACGASNSNSGDSFVEGILDRDSEIRAAFPELLDDAFDY